MEIINIIVIVFLEKRLSGQEPIISRREGRGSRSEDVSEWVTKFTYK